VLNPSLSGSSGILRIFRGLPPGPVSPKLHPTAVESPNRVIINRGSDAKIDEWLEGINWRYMSN
jgi:hypothetical protein